METGAPSLLHVPITDAERSQSSSRSRSHSPRESSSTLIPPSQSYVHGRDRQLDPQLGRFSSLRHPGERYDDPDLNYSSTTARPSLPDIYEESHYSDHGDEEPLNPPVKSTTLLRTSDTAYAPVRSAPEPNLLTRHQSPHSPTVTQKYWLPIWLKKLFLIGLIVFQALIIIALAIVCYASDFENGYRIPTTTSQYAWAWLPTACFVFLAALWRQIDFHTKTLTPWKELAEGSISPSDSLLVDYISSFQIIAFMSAVKRIHNPVIISVSAFVVAQLMAIAATGLFVLEGRSFRDNFSTTITTFDSAALNQAILTTSTFPNTSVYTYTQNVGSSLSHAAGVTPDFAYVVPILYSSSKPVPGNATYNATTDIFVPSISCRLANVTVQGEETIETTDFPYNSTDTPYGSPSDLILTINENDECTKWPQLTFRGLDPLHFVVPVETLESRSIQVSCEDDPNVNPILLLSLVDVEYTQELLANVTRPEGGDLPIALNTQRSVTRMVNVICQADYTLSQVNVTNNTALQGSPAITLKNIAEPNNRTLNGLSSADMTKIFSTMLNSNTGLFPAADDPDFIRTPAFDLLAFAAGTGMYTDFLNGSDSLAVAAERLFLGTMPNFASKNLIATGGTSFNRGGPIASIEWSEDRLYTNWTAVILLLTGLGLVILATLALIIFMPKNIVPRDPNTIAAAATTLARSTELNRLLRKLQSPQTKGVAAALNGYRVGTAIASDDRTGTQSFKIHVNEGRPQRNVHEVAPGVKFWNPTWASLPALIITVCVPLILIALLQVTQNMSDSKQGLLDVPDNKGTLIGSHYVPALVTLLVAALINNLDFYLALFAPWSKLHKTSAAPEQSILTSVLGNFAPNAIRHAFKARYWGAMLSCIATIFASLLTTVISGLFEVQHFDAVGPTRSLSQLDTFNLQSSYTVDFDSGAGAMLNLIQHNSSFPANTWDELAIPQLSVGSLASPIPYGSHLVGSTQATVPALRGNLRCESESSLSVTTVDSVVRVDASYTVPNSCFQGIDSLETSTVDFAVDFIPTDGTAQFGGKMFDLRFGSNSSDFGHLGEANSSLVGDNPSVGCPSLVFVWGYFRLGDDGSNKANVAVCYQTIQSINANVTFQQNTTDFDERTPPRYNDTTAETQPNPNDTDTFDFRIQDNLARQLGDFVSDPNVDAYFQAMLSGSIKMDVDKFVGNRQLAMMGINHLYRQYMAQVINSMMRVPIEDGNDDLKQEEATTLTALRTTITRSRLVQDNTVKNILHSLLALSALLILMGYFLTKTRNVLPCNPCSIAGTMALLAGSDMCYAPDNGVCECCGKIRKSSRSMDGQTQLETIHADDNEHADDDRVVLIRSGAEWWDNKTFARVFEGRTYRLGWWEADKTMGKTRRYVVDYGDHPTDKASSEWYLGKRKDNESFEIFAESTAPVSGRGRTRARSDVNERGQYHRPEPSPGEEVHEMRDLGPNGRSLNQDGRYGDG